MDLNLDTAITAMSALMIVMLVPSGRLISYLLDLTSSQAVVMGWAPLVSASFLFIWIPSGELAAPTNYLPGSTDIPSLSWQLGSLLPRVTSRKSSR